MEVKVYICKLGRSKITADFNDSWADKNTKINFLQFCCCCCCSFFHKMQRIERESDLSITKEKQVSASIQECLICAHLLELSQALQIPIFFLDACVRCMTWRDLAA